MRDNETQKFLDEVNAGKYGDKIKIYTVIVSLANTARAIKLITTSAEQARISTCNQLLPHMAWRNGDMIIVKPLAGGIDSGRWKYNNKTWIAI